MSSPKFMTMGIVIKFSVRRGPGRSMHTCSRPFASPLRRNLLSRRIIPSTSTTCRRNAAAAAAVQEAAPLADLSEIPRQENTHPWRRFDIPLPSSHPETNDAAIRSARNFGPVESRHIGDTTARILHTMLRAHGVDHVYCSPICSSSPIFNDILRSDELRQVFARHEQGGGHIAQGYARVTGKPGVVLVPSGFALTNMITPIQDALSDGTPMVVICAESALEPISFASQDVEVLALSQGCTKWNVRVTSAEDLPRRIEEAFAIACNGRPGPVLVHLPRDLEAAVLRRPSLPSTYLKQRVDHGRGSLAKPAPFEELDQSLYRVANLVNIAERPVIYAGQGVMAHPRGAQVLKDFSDKTSIPVTTSLQGLGTFDELDEKALHMLGMYGTGYANLAVQNADLIISLGARFDDRVTGHVEKFAPKTLEAAKEGRGGIVHFDIAPKNVNKIVLATETVRGDCTINLSKLTTLVRPVSQRPEWFQQIQSWKRKYPLSAYNKFATKPEPGLIQTQAVIEKLSDMTKSFKDKTIISTGVGQHQMWAAQHFRWRFPRTMVTSGGLGTMGYGLPAAIGAKLGKPASLVIDIDGDASFNMTIAELATAAQHKIGVKVLLFNNEQMGMISDIQRFYYEERFSQNRQRNPDFVQASESYGVPAKRCTKPENVEAMLEWLISSEGPALLEVLTEQHSAVCPMVPAGKGLDEFVTYETDQML